MALSYFDLLLLLHRHTNEFRNFEFCCVRFWFRVIYILFRLHFTDVPETKVKLGSSLDPNTIREGTDVYFDCLVTAHPHVYKVEWRHNVNMNIHQIFKQNLHIFAFLSNIFRF